MITITVKGEEFQLDITEDQYYELRDGERDRHVQDIAPDLAPCEREIFITQITPKEWDKMFGGCHMWDGACNYYSKNGKCKYNCRLATEEDEDGADEELYFDDNPDPTGDDITDDKPF